MGALQDFQSRFGSGGGGGTGNVLQDFESRFNFARLNPKNSQKAGGLNRLTEEQLASFGYKPSDIEDWNDLPERKQKKLEDVLTQISSSNISPYLAPGYKIGSISERDKGNPGQMQDLSTRGGLQAGLRGGAGGVLEGVIRGGSDMFGFGGHSVGEYTDQYLRQHPEIDPANLVKVPGKEGVYVDRKNTPYTWREPVQAGLNVALMRGLPASKFLGAGSTVVGRTAGAALKGGLENTAFGLATDALNNTGSMEGRTQAFDGSFGSRMEAALTNAPSNFAIGAALGSVIGQKKKTSPDDNLTNIFFADKELRSLVKKQNSLEGVLGVINDANISKEVKRDLTKKVNTLSDTLALPEPKVAAYGEGFTMNNADNSITSAAKQIKSIEKKLSDMESGKVATTPQDYLSLKQHRDDLVKSIQDNNAPQPISRAKVNDVPVVETAPNAGGVPTQGLAGNTGGLGVVGEGKTRQSQLGRSTQQKAVDAKLTETLGDVPEYQQVNMADQARASTDLLKKEEARATRIALGKEEPPTGIIPEAVYTAVEEKALRDGNVGLLNDLAHSTRVTEATAMGQRIRALGERDPDSAVAAIRSIIEKRKPTGKDAKVVTKTAQEIQAMVKKTTRQDWQSFVESIKC